MGCEKRFKSHVENQISLPRKSREKEPCAPCNENVERKKCPSDHARGIEQVEMQDGCQSSQCGKHGIERHQRPNGAPILLS